MTAPAIRFGDPQRATRDALRALLPAYGLDATVTMSRPDLAEGVPLPRPHVRVRSGAVRRGSRVSAEADIRLTVFADDEGAAMTFAADVEAILLAEAAGPDLFGFGPLTGPVPGTDTDTGRPIAFVTLAARLRPRSLPRKD